MPLDRRSRRVVFVAHCVLNQNVRYTGGAHYPAMIDGVVDALQDLSIGLVQMPCPEFTFAGLDRPSCTKEEYDTPGFREHCRAIASSIAKQVEHYAKDGFRVLAIMGVERSPSCGVEQTTTRTGGPGGKAKPTIGQGVFIEELQGELSSRRLIIPFKGLDWGNISGAIEELQMLLVT